MIFNIKTVCSAALTIFTKVLCTLLKGLKIHVKKIVPILLAVVFLILFILCFLGIKDNSNAIEELTVSYNEHVVQSEQQMKDIEQRFVEVESIIVIKEDMSALEEQEQPIPEEEEGPNLHNSSLVFISSDRPIFNLSEEDIHRAESMVAGEAGGQSFDGMVAVAQAIMNGMIRSNYTVEEVRVNYQYAGWHNIDKFTSLYPEAGQEVKDAVEAVFKYQCVVTEENIVWFLNPDKSSPNAWHYSQKEVIRVDNHLFFAPHS